MPFDFDSNLINNSNMDGIKVFFEIDVQFCRAMQLKLDKDILCFSEMENVAAYLGVASAKNVIQNVPFKINAAEAIGYKPNNTNTEAYNIFFTLLASAFILLVCIVVVVQITNRKRKFVCAPIFRPSSLTHSKIFFNKLFFYIFFR